MLINNDKSLHNKSIKNILLVFTGGTIGSVATCGTINTSKKASFKLIQLFQQHYENHSQIHFDTLQPLQILSEDLAPRAWQTLIAAIETARPEQYDGIVITHGTDTLAYTACALSFYFNGSRLPMLLVSSDYPLDHPKANGLENFICAIEFIRQINQDQIAPTVPGFSSSGVFVPYQNQQQITQLHRATHLASSLQLSGDFFSIQHKSYLQFKNRQFSPVQPISKATPIKHIPLKAIFSERILMIKAYPGLNYTSFNLENVDAVLHDLYHSGTASTSLQWGENYSLLKFIKDCVKRNITVYLSPAIKSPDTYQGTLTLIEQGAHIIWNMSIEAAYVKLLLAYGNFEDKQQIINFLSEDLAGEHL